MPEVAHPPAAEIPEAVLSGWRTEVGHRAEEDFAKILTSQLGVEEVSPEEVDKPEVAETLHKEQRIALARATARQDFEQGIDFFLFNPLAGHWIRMDFSVSGDPRVHTEKRAREKHQGIRFLPLAKGTVDQAHRGGYEALGRVHNAVTELLVRDTLESAQKGELELSPRRREVLEKKLQSLQTGGTIH